MTKIQGFALLSGLFLAAILTFPAYAQSKDKQSAPSGITLDQAVASALQNAPEITGSNALNKAADAARRQSTAWQNPELAVEAENIGGSGPYKGYDSAEATITVAQLVEIGGKRSARRSVAEREQALAQLDQKKEILNVVRQVKIAFAKASAAQERLKLARQQSKLSDDIFAGVKRRVDAAADPLYQKNKARIAQASSNIALRRAEREQATALEILGQLTGSKVERVDTSAFHKLDEPAQLGITEPDLVITREDLEVEKSKAAYALERANAVPDPTITAGIRNLREDDENTFVVGLSFPIPVLNLNRGNIQKAGYEIAARDAERQQTIRDTKTEIMERQKLLSDAYQEAKALQEDILPEAEAALKDARRGYSSGAFAYLDVLDAQRTLFESKTAYLDTLLEYQANQAEVEYLTAPVNSMEKK